MSVCLLPEKVDAFRAALKNKDLDIKKLLNMSTEERTAALREYAGDNAKDVNTMFEQKLVLKNRIAGLKNWAAKLGEIGKYSKEGSEEVAKALADYRAKQQERIFSPAEDEAFLNDLADKKLGVHVSPEVANKVFELSQKADALKEKNAKLSGVSDEYLQARQELDKYVQDQEPVSAAHAIGQNIATIMRNNLLLNFSTPFKTLENQTVNSLVDAGTRRIAAAKVSGENADLVKKANSEAWETFIKTGADTTTDDLHNTLGEGRRLETPANANRGDKAMITIANLTHIGAKFSNKVAITYEHQFGMTFMRQRTFFDAANVFASKFSEKAGVSPEEIFKDAARIEPQTAVGSLVRQHAQAQAMRVVSLNSNVLEASSMAVKNTFDKYGAGLAGKVIVPIAKIPATLIYNNLENAGFGLFTAGKDIYEGRIGMKSADTATYLQGLGQTIKGWQTMSRTVGSLGVAALIVKNMPSSNFKQDQYGVSYIKLGNYWVNTEFIPVIGTAMAGMFYVKSKAKRGTGVAEDLQNYTIGAGKTIVNAPGWNDIIAAISNPAKEASSFLTSRIAPAFVYNILKNEAFKNFVILGLPKPTDDAMRTLDRLLFGAHGIESQRQVNKDKQQNPNAAI